MIGFPLKLQSKEVRSIHEKPSVQQEKMPNWDVREASNLSNILIIGDLPPCSRDTMNLVDSNFGGRLQCQDFVSGFWSSPRRI